MAATLSISNEKNNVSVDDILKEGILIFKKYKDTVNDPYNQKLIEQMFQQVRQEHPDFTQSYPIVVRYILQFKMFNEKAFRRWLNFIKVNPWKTEQDYINAHGDYVFVLWKEYHPKLSRKELQNIRSNVVKELMTQHKTFKKYHAEAEKKVEAETEANKIAVKNELLEFLQSDTAKELLERFDNRFDLTEE